MKKRAATSRMMVLSSVLLALFLILAIAAYFNGTGVERDSELISDDAVPGSIDAHVMRSALSNCMRFESLAAITGSAADRADSLAHAQEAWGKFERAYALYPATIIINPGRDRALLGNVTVRVEAFARQRKVFEEMVRAGDRAGSLDFFQHGLVPTFVEAAQATDELVNYNNANARAYAVNIARSIRTLRWTVVVVLALALICGVILAGNLASRWREQRELRESERHLREVLDNLFAFVGVFDLDGTLVEVNRAPLEATGLRREDVIGRHFSQIAWWAHSPEATARMEANLVKAAAGEFVRYDAELRGADGRRIMTDHGCGPLRDAAGRVSQVVVTAVDITERKQLEQQFLQAQRMEAVGMLSSGLAHDLNNILAPMLMAAGLLRLRPLSDRDRGIIAMIEGGAQRGAGIIRQLLTLGRGSDGEKGELQVRHLLGDMMHIIRETFPRNIVLEHDAPADLWPLVADATQVHQMLLNLCVNARDAMPRGGRLSLLAGNLLLDEAGARARPAAKPGRYVVLTVADTGSGIPKENLERIFEPFFTTKPVGAGTGLGLASVLNIVKGHGGFLTVESEPGQGTTFRAHLPAGESTRAVAAPEAPDQLPSGQRELILLVEDEPAMRAATREMLEIHNYRVITAANGEEAVQLFVEHRESVNLVLSDLHMPVMDGLELFRSLRVLDDAVRFLPMTGSGDAGKTDGLAEMGLTEILRKPCDPALLLRTLHRIFQPTREA